MHQVQKFFKGKPVVLLDQSTSRTPYDLPVQEYRVIVQKSAALLLAVTAKFTMGRLRIELPKSLKDSLVGPRDHRAGTRVWTADFF